MLDWDIILKDKVLIYSKSFNRDNILINMNTKHQDKVNSTLSLSQVYAYGDLILIHIHAKHQDLIPVSNL